MAVILEGAFPFNWFSSSVLVVDTATPLGLGKNMPKMLAAVAIDATHVRVSFDVEMEHTNPIGPSDTLNPANYAFTVSGGVSISASTVALHQASPTIVDIALVGEMTNGANYEVIASNVKSLAGQEIDPAYDTQAFTGVGTAPQVDSAVATDSTHVRVVFDEAMLNEAALVLATNYIISGPTVPTVSSVVRDNPTQVTLLVTEMRDGGLYDVTVSNVRDLAENVIDPAHDTASFTGVGVAPQLLPTVTPIDSSNFYIDYSESMNALEAINVANYSIVPSLGALNILQISGTRYRINTVLEQQLGVTYEITATNVHDLVGNPIDPAHDSALFSGYVLTPPLLYFYPGDLSAGVAPREYLRVQAVDVVPAPSGIDLTTWDVRIAHGHLTQYVLRGGVPNTDEFDVSFFGDAADAVMGVYVRFRPKRGHWEENTAYTVYSLVKDHDGAGSTAQWLATFGAYTCFEDLPEDPAAIDTKLLSAVRLPACDRLRQITLRLFSTSANRTAQARTILWFATQTELRPVVAVATDTSVAAVKLCDVRPLLEIHAGLRTQWQVVEAALKELKQFSGQRVMVSIEQALRSASSLHVVSAVATMIVFAAYA